MPRIFSRIKWILGLFILIFLTVPIAADETTDKVDKIFAEWDKTTTPGAALAVIKDGRIIYERGYGMAKLEDGLVITPTKIFDIGSCSKQFTAACLAMLIQEGKVALGDDIWKYFPEMPRYEKPITVGHLIHHTSGLRDYNALLGLAGFRSESDCPNIDEALAVICKQKRLNYPPGEEYSYTNTGYFLMGQIVERVSGKSLNEFAQERIFKPLGMTHTIYQDDHTQIVKNRATGYEPSEDGYKINLSNWDETGDGNVYTSVEDLSLWDQAFYNNELGKDLMDTLHTVGVLNNGKKIDYAYGLRIADYKGLKTVGHGGSWAGFRVGIVRFPEQKFSVICLSNLSGVNPSDLCLKVADIYLADLLKEKPKEEKKKIEAITLSREVLEEKIGNYQDEKFGTWVSLTMKEDKLRMALGRREIPLEPISQTTFQTVGGPADLTFEIFPEVKGRPRKALIKSPEEELYSLVKAAPLPPMTHAKLKEYAGDYVSEELLNATYRFIVEKDNLVLRFRSVSPDPLKAMAPDKFTQGSRSFEFIRKGNGVTGIKLSVGRAANIEFEKK
jgi:CubicO group peptidase (beta-lactamase class C family)